MTGSSHCPFSHLYPQHRLQVVWCYQILQNGEENDRITVCRGMVWHLSIKWPFPYHVQGKSTWECYDGKCWTTFFQIEKPRFIGFAHICGVNPPTVVYFNLPPCYHWMGVGKRHPQSTGDGQLIGVRARTALREGIFHRVFHSVYPFPKLHPLLYLCRHTHKHIPHKDKNKFSDTTHKLPIRKENFLKCSIIFKAFS